VLLPVKRANSQRSLADKELAMRASLQRVLHALTGRRPPATEDMTIGVLPSMRRRRGWARSVERLLAAAGHRPDARQFRHPDWEAPLMLRTQVVRTCHAELAAINAALLDQRQPVSAQALRQLKPFLNDPNASPLFGEDPALARKAAEQLQWSFTGRPEP
jgi:hypothetical protein